MGLVARFFKHNNMGFETLFLKRSMKSVAHFCSLHFYSENMIYTLGCRHSSHLCTKRVVSRVKTLRHFFQRVSRSLLVFSLLLVCYGHGDTHTRLDNKLQVRAVTLVKHTELFCTFFQGPPWATQDPKDPRRLHGGSRYSTSASFIDPRFASQTEPSDCHIFAYLYTDIFRHSFCISVHIYIHTNRHNIYICICSSIGTCFLSVTIQMATSLICTCFLLVSHPNTGGGLHQAAAYIVSAVAHTYFCS